MANIIVLTDFSDSAQNALEYACAFSAASSKIRLMLVNISDVPTSYSGDGVAMAAISDTLRDKNSRLQESIADVMVYPNRPAIQYKALLGNFIPTLLELIEEEQAGLIIMGTPAAYGEIWAWDTDTLTALTELPVPVLTVPVAVRYHSIANIAFASIPGALHSASPIESIKKFVRYTGARLHVVMVASPQSDERKEKEATSNLQQHLQDLNPEYHFIRDPHIVQAIGRFVEEQHIDLLLVRPRKHGIWYNLFHKSYAKELAKLNLIPVMALHDQWEVE